MKFVKISHKDIRDGSYIDRIENLPNVIDEEFDGVEEWLDDDFTLNIELVEMDEEEFKKLPEFAGW